MNHKLTEQFGHSKSHTIVYTHSSNRGDVTSPGEHSISAECLVHRRDNKIADFGANRNRHRPHRIQQAQREGCASSGAFLATIQELADSFGIFLVGGRAQDNVHQRAELGLQVLEKHCQTGKTNRVYAYRLWHIRIMLVEDITRHLGRKVKLRPFYESIWCSTDR